MKKSLKVLALSVSLAGLIGIGSTIANSSSNNVHVAYAASNYTQVDKDATATATFNEINRLRTQNGLPALQRNADLDAIAAQRAENGYNMSKAGKNAHTGYTKINYPAGFIAGAENLAFNSVSTDPASADANKLGQEFVIQWYEDSGTPSFGHRKAMLSDKFTSHVGVGIYQNGSEIVAALDFAGTSDLMQKDGGVAGYNNFYSTEMGANSLGHWAQYHYDLVDNK